MHVFFLKQQIQELEATLYNALQQDKVSTNIFISNTFLGGDFTFEKSVEFHQI